MLTKERLKELLKNALDELARQEIWFKEGFTEAIGITEEEYKELTDKDLNEYIYGEDFYDDEPVDPLFERIAKGCGLDGEVDGGGLFDCLIETRRDE